jgi:hypothetical protein
MPRFHGNPGFYQTTRVKFSTVRYEHVHQLSRISACCIQIFVYMYKHGGNA